MMKRCMVAVLCVGLSLLVGCGTNGSPVVPAPAPAPNIPPPPSPISIMVSPQAVRVTLGSTQQFTASVNNVPSVIWQVNGITGGNELLGTISNTGLYTAPGIIPIDSSVLIAALAASDNTIFGTALVFVGAIPGIHYAYVSSAVDDSIQVFTADNQTGMLESKSTFWVGAGKGPTALAISPTGKFLYSLNRGSNDISILAIDETTGELAAVGAVSAPDGPYDIVFSPTGDYAYVSCDTASTVAAYALSLDSGILTSLSGSYVAGNGRIQDLAISSDGRFLYATNADTNKIVGLVVQEDGSLRVIDGSPFPAGPGLSSIVVDDAYAYIGYYNGIGIFRRGPSSGLLVFAGNTATGGNSPELFGNLSTGYLLGVDPANGSFFSFELDGDYLDPWARSPISAGTHPAPGGLLFNPDYYPSAYVLNGNAEGSSTGSISVYSIVYDGAHGPLATIPTLRDPTGFAVTP